jgi:ERCC4-related helicase
MDEGLSFSHRMNFETVGSWVYPTNYPIRKYQRDISESCLLNNTLVSLPTGMGKTLIAAVVMYNYWRWFPDGIVIFMAPTKPLVSQQILACCDIMGIPETEFAQLDGTIAIETRESQWETKKIFFCTPQVVENDLLQGRLSWRRIVCVVIDEAHRASGNYAYVKVVSNF